MRQVTESCGHLDNGVCSTMSKKQIGWLVIVLSVIAFLVASAIKQNTREAIAMLAGAAVSGALLLVVEKTFAGQAVLRSPCLYYVAFSLSLFLGFVMYTLLAPLPSWASPWSVKLLLSAIASMSIVLLSFPLAKLIKVRLLPWERDNRKSQT